MLLVMDPSEQTGRHSKGTRLGHRANFDEAIFGDRLVMSLFGPPVVFDCSYQELQQRLRSARWLSKNLKAFTKALRGNTLQQTAFSVPVLCLNLKVLWGL